MTRKKKNRHSLLDDIDLVIKRSAYRQAATEPCELLIPRCSSVIPQRAPHTIIRDARRPSAATGRIHLLVITPAEKEPRMPIHSAARPLMSHLAATAALIALTGCGGGGGGSSTTPPP